VKTVETKTPGFATGRVLRWSFKDERSPRPDDPGRRGRRRRDVPLRVTHQGEWYIATKTAST
jgi:hypothetical protein